ncbi:MAG: hypothetical protein NZ742_01005 [Acidobacteria bacterium]|nr:hypothetical protein [Acidobacteriota bacterium]MDW7983231.1 hypothetical protein [Acidobacteriota bacterium]
MNPFEAWQTEERLAFRGTLEERNLGDVLVQMWRERMAGIVVAEIPTAHRAFLVREGHLAFAYSDDPDDRLGEVLLRQGRIDLIQLDTATRQTTQSQKKLGTVLIEMGVLAAEELTEALSLQVRTILYDTMNARTGTYSAFWMEEDETVPGIPDLKIDTLTAVFDGARRVQRWSVIQRGLPPLDAIPVTTPKEVWSGIAVTLSPEENHVLSLCTGNFSIKTICSLSYLNSFDTARLLWALRLVGLIEFHSMARPATASSPTISIPPSFGSMPSLGITPPAGMTLTNHPEYQDYILQELLQRYNDMYQEVVETLSRVITEDDLHRFLEATLAPIRAALPHRMKDVHINAYGEIDYDTFVRNFATMDFETKIREMSSVLEDILYSLIYGLDQVLPSEQAREVQQRILAKHRGTS